MKMRIRDILRWRIEYANAASVEGSIQPERGKDCMNYIKELLFPGRCVVCDEIVGKLNRPVCEGCRGKFVPISEPWCLKCGKQLSGEEKEYCADCSRGRHLFTRGRAVFTYDSVASSLYRFKYGGRGEYARYYGECAAKILQDEIEFRKADAIIPVPLHPVREHKRGYNQAELFGKALGAAWNIPVKCNYVVRRKNTKPLKEFNPSQRQNNLKKAFKLMKNDVKLNTIIIVDDIYTTGSTIDRVADVFLKAGVRKVFFVTLAVGKGF